MIKTRTFAENPSGNHLILSEYGMSPNNIKNVKKWKK